MDFRVLALFIMTVLLFGVGLLVYFKNRKSIVNISYGLFVIFMALWSLGLAMFYISSEIDKIFFWAKFLYVAGSFIAAFFFYFSLVFPLGKISISRFKQFFIFVPNIILFILFFFSDFILQGVIIQAETRGFVYGPGHILFDLQFDTFFIWGLLNLVRKYKRSTDIVRAQLKYVILGTSLGLAVAGTTNVILPWFNNFRFLWVGAEAAFIWIVFNSYAILKYRLMDIRMVVKRSTVFSGIVIAITAAYVLAAFLLSRVFFKDVDTFRNQVIVGLIVAFFIAIGFRPLYDWLKRITDTFLFKGEYKPQELMADISDVLSRTLDLDRVITTLREQISRALRTAKMEVIILEEGILREVPVKNLKVALEKIINYFKKQKEVLVLEELKRKYAEKNGFDKDFLLINDLEKLEAIGSQAAIAVENARLYEEMKDFSKTLQKEVNRQTKNLREANIRLEQLDKAKSEFISLASHQLRTPLSIIKGYISMFLEGAWGETTKKQKEHLEKVYTSNERLIKLVEDLLTVSRIESGRLEFDFQLLDLANLTESIIKDFSQIAAKKELYLKYLKPARLLPKVKADSLKIRQVIQNLIDNALHYTEKGGATIQLKTEGNRVVFSIEDTGIGISSEERVTLFEKFSRGKGVTKMHTEGTGLGLYLAAKLVEAHQGRIWIESEGKGKGSVFYFELPVNKLKS